MLTSRLEAADVVIGHLAVGLKSAYRRDPPGQLELLPEVIDFSGLISISVHTFRAFVLKRKVYSPNGKFSKANIRQTQDICLNMKIMPKRYPYDDIVAPMARE